MATKVEWGGGGKAFVAVPLNKELSFFCGFPTEKAIYLGENVLTKIRKNIIIIAFFVRDQNYYEEARMRR